MSASQAARRAHLLAERALIDAGGGGALLLYPGTMEPNPETPASAAPLAIVALAPVSFDLHATLAEMTLVPAQGFAAVSGQPTWARFVDGAGTPVRDCTAGPPGSGAQVIVTDGKPVPSSQMYVGGEVNVTSTFSNPA